MKANLFKKPVQTTENKNLQSKTRNISHHSDINIINVNNLTVNQDNNRDNSILKSLEENLTVNFRVSSPVTKKYSQLNVKTVHHKSLFGESKTPKNETNSGPYYGVIPNSSHNLRRDSVTPDYMENTAQIKVIGRFRPFNQFETVINLFNFRK